MLQSERDEILISEIKEVLNSGDEISIPIIQRRFQTGYNLAFRVFTELEKEGFIIRGENKNGVSKVK